ncbi:hypothetical protein Bp8pS_145 [Bacillus phage vB_BpuM-BpSp]|nr:hypothetical protein Bp8pS_145 [Bacillus phage vB_BpuM-BpSp]
MLLKEKVRPKNNLFIQCSTVIINENKQVLLGTKIDLKEETLRLIDEGILKAKWTLPSGKIEENESLEDCAIRELKEEFNVTRNNIRKFKKLDDIEKYFILDGEPFMKRCSVYIAKLKDNFDYNTIIPQENEIGQVGFFNREEVMFLLNNGCLHYFTAQALLLSMRKGFL